MFSDIKVTVCLVCLREVLEDKGHPALYKNQSPDENPPQCCSPLYWEGRWKLQSTTYYVSVRWSTSTSHNLSAPHNEFPFPLTMRIFSKDVMSFQAHMHSTFLDWDFLSPTVYLVNPGELCKHQLPTPAGCSTRAFCVMVLPTRDAYSRALLCYLPQSLHHPIDYLPSVRSRLRCRA